MNLVYVIDGGPPQSVSASTPLLTKTARVRLRDCELAAGRFIAQREDARFLGPPGTGRVIWPKPSAAR